MDLATAERYAVKIAGNLEPFCERIQIAGSIRRHKPDIGDIDLVVIPKNLNDLMARCRTSCKPIMEGQVNLSYETPMGIRLDIYCAQAGFRDLYNVTASNWGSLLLCRTGSKEHNTKLADLALRRGMKWKPYVGLMDSQNLVIAAEEEEDIFRALGLDFVPPEQREA